MILVDPIWRKVSYGQYTGFDFHVEHYIFFTVLSFIFFFIISSINNKNLLFSLIKYILTVISIVPLFSMHSLSAIGDEFSIMSYLYWSFFIIFLKFSNIIRPINRDKVINYRMMVVLLLPVCFFVATYLGISTNFRIDLNILRAYDYRTTVFELKYPPMFTYLKGLAKIAIPTLIVFAMVKRNFLLLAAMFMCSALIYSFDGSKALFLISVLAILISFIPEYLFHYRTLLYGTIFLFLLGILDALYSSGLFAIIVLRRLFFVPTLVSSYWYSIPSIKILIGIHSY